MAQKLKVLVVDDESSYCEQLSLILRRSGHEVESALDVKTARETARRFNPQVLLIDFMLKDEVSGLDLARELQASNQHLATILMSGYLAAELRGDAHNQGAVASLEKPFELSELLNAIDKAVQSPLPSG